MFRNLLEKLFSKPVVRTPAEPAPTLIAPPVVVQPIVVDTIVEPVVVAGLQDPAAFYDYIRKEKLYGPTISQSELEGTQEILLDCAKAGWPIAYVAYALATAYHETAGTMQPIKEYGGAAYFNKRYGVEGDNPERARKMGNTNPGDGAKYCGRGYVQLTWKNNYARAEMELGVPLLSNPDLAMYPDIASDIMIRGMSEGWFTGKKLSTYLPSTRLASISEFNEARRIINGLDKSQMIAEYAISFQLALLAGEWV